MKRKLYAIQISDYRGNWVTVKHASLLGHSYVGEELRRELKIRSNRNIRAIEIATDTVVMELCADDDIGTLQDEARL